MITLVFRSILSEKDLDKDMLSAQNEELARQKRLQELKKSLLRDNAAASSTAPPRPKVTPVGTSASAAKSSTASTGTATMASASTETETPKEKDPQLKSLLQGKAK